MMDKRLLALVPEALRHVLATVAWPLLAAGIVLLAVSRALLRARPAAGHQGRHALRRPAHAAAPSRDDHPPRHRHPPREAGIARRVLLGALDQRRAIVAKS